jgi:hypothetical protein
MKYEVKGLTSYGVYDGDRLLTTYESETTAQCVADALNDEAARVETTITADLSRVNEAAHTLSTALTRDESWTLNGQDKETI